MLPSFAIKNMNFTGNPVDDVHKVQCPGTSKLLPGARLPRLMD